MTQQMIDLMQVQRTDATGVDEVSAPVQTVASLTREYGLLRDKTAMLSEDVGDGHRQAQATTLELLSRNHARRSVEDLLVHLSAEVGMSWSDIAHAVGVSVQSLRKWRRGEPCTGENRLAVARLLAVLDMLEAQMVSDPAGWMEIPVLRGYNPRHVDVVAADRPDLLLDLASMRISPEEVLTVLNPAWRTEWARAHEVFRAEDGEPSIRRRSERPRGKP